MTRHTKWTAEGLLRWVGLENARQRYVCPMVATLLLNNTTRDAPSISQLIMKG